VSAAGQLPALLTAPAKLTRWLRVVGTRPDGLHLIEAEMVSLDLADRIDLSAGDGLEVVDETALSPGRQIGLPVEAGGENLVARALAAVGRTARVRLHKRVPAGAGLGGGSSDAAAVLRWAGVTPEGEGLSLAASLGADVPFCLVGGRAEVAGIGEQVSPLPFAPLSFTLLLLPFGVSTAEVYQRWDALGGPVGEGPNDLETPALEAEPRLAAWRDALGQATGARPVLAGSGSTWFVEGAYAGLAGSFPPPGGQRQAGHVVVCHSQPAPPSA